MDTLDELRAAVQRDPRRVAGAAAELAAQARASGDLAALSRSLGVLGRARRALGDIALAESDLVGAIGAGQLAGDDELVADACVGLAGVLMFAGRSGEALAHLETADRLGSERVRAYASLQRAVVAQKLGHPQEALAAYAAALPTLRQLDARVDVAMVLMNRGVVRAQSGDFRDAVVDLTEAGELFRADGNSYGVAQSCHGLGWAYARHGELVRALEHLDRAADQFRELGYQGLEIDVDRVECLLEAGLSTAAAELGRATAGRAAAAGDHLHAAQMWLMCARAAFLEGDLIGGVRNAERARELFAEQGSVLWQSIARLEVVRGGLGTARDTEADVEDLCVLADELDRCGHARGSATAYGLAALAACAAGAVDRAITLADVCARAADRLGVFELRLVAEHARATCSLARGDRVGARRRVRAGLADLGRHRASLASADARASVAIHAGHLAALGLRLAVASGSASEVFDLIEVARAGRRRHPGARPLIDPTAAAELVELRSVVAEIRAYERDGRDAVELLHRQRDLEQAVHRRRLRTADDDPDADHPLVRLTALRSHLGGRHLVEMVEIDGHLVAVVVGPGRARLIDVGPVADVVRPIATVATALRTAVAPNASPARQMAARDLLARAVGALDHGLGDLLRGDCPLILVVPPALQAIPWQLLSSVGGRPVVVAPSATWWADAAAAPMTRQRPRTVAVAGPRLVEAVFEAQSVASCYPTHAVLAGPDATVAALTEALAGATTVHVASHGRIRQDNPLWSSLELVDGPLYVYDIEAMAQTPQTVVLSGCETGVGVAAGDGLLGLSTVLLERGTRSLIASVCLLPDSVDTRETMTRLHSRIAAGSAPSVALAALVTESGPGLASTIAASLTCIGTS